MQEVRALIIYSDETDRYLTKMVSSGLNICLSGKNCTILFQLDDDGNLFTQQRHKEDNNDLELTDLINDEAGDFWISDNLGRIKKI